MSVALTSRFLTAFTGVLELRPGLERHIEPVVSRYRDHGARAAFELVPDMYDEAPGRGLARLGFPNPPSADARYRYAQRGRRLKRAARRDKASGNH